MSPWKVILATVVIFCSGLVVGTLITKKSLRPAQVQHSFQRGQSNAVSSVWHLQQKELIRRIDKELTITPEQRTRIEKILKESQERTKQIRERIAPEMREEVKKVREQIRGELRPDQQEKFENAMKARSPRKPDGKSEEPNEDRRRKDGPRRSATNTVSTNLTPSANP